MSKITENKKQKPSQNTVFVALNHPSGLSFTMPCGRLVNISGNAAHLKGAEKGCLTAGAFGLTEISEEDWAYIQHTYQTLSLFKNGLIFAQTKQDKAADQI
ncbi:MAG: hypothetical protein ACRCTY_05515, partial [Candidatus Adiutrix sp.]